MAKHAAGPDTPARPLTTFAEIVFEVTGIRITSIEAERIRRRQVYERSGAPTRYFEATNGYHTTLVVACTGEGDDDAVTLRIFAEFITYQKEPYDRIFQAALGLYCDAGKVTDRTPKVRGAFRKAWQARTDITAGATLQPLVEREHQTYPVDIHLILDD